MGKRRQHPLIHDVPCGQSCLSGRLKSHGKTPTPRRNSQQNPHLPGRKLLPSNHIYRDYDGHNRQVGRHGKTKNADQRALAEAIRDRNQPVENSTLTPATTLTDSNGPAVAKAVRSVLSGMCRLACTHDAMERNPVSEATPIAIKAKRKPRPSTRWAAICSSSA